MLACAPTTNVTASPGSLPVAQVVPLLPVAEAVPVRGATKRTVADILDTVQDNVPVSKRAAVGKTLALIAPALTARAVEAAAAVDGLTAEVADLKATRLVQDEALAKATADNFALERKVGRLAPRVATLRTELDNAREADRVSREQLVNGEAARTALREELATAQRERDELVASSQRLSAELEEMRAAAPPPPPACACCMTPLFTALGNDGAVVACDADECSHFLCKGCIVAKVHSDLPTLTADGVRCTDPVCAGTFSSRPLFYSCIDGDLLRSFTARKEEAVAARAAAKAGATGFVKAPCKCGQAAGISFAGCATIRCDTASGGCGAFYNGIDFTVYRKGEIDPAETNTQLSQRAHAATRRVAEANGLGDSYYVPRRHAPEIERRWMRYHLVETFGKKALLTVFPDYEKASKARLAKWLEFAGLPTGGYGMA